MSQSYLPFLGYGGSNISVLNPLQLFGNNLKGWLKADSGNMFFPAVSDGEKIPQFGTGQFGWLDNSNFANMNLGGEQSSVNPVYKDNQINGLGGILFNGNAGNYCDSTLKSAWSFLHQSTNSIIILAKVNSGGTDLLKILLATGGQVSGNIGISLNFRNDSGFEGVVQHLIRNGTGTIHLNTKTSTGTINFNTFQVYEFNYDTTQGNIYTNFSLSKNQSTVGSPSSATFTDNTVRLGEPWNALNRRFQDVVSEIIILDKIMSASERENLKKYFNDKYILGIP